MKIIGLTGGIATGKTTVLKIFKKLGYPTISCDDIYHELLKTDKKLKSRLVKVFGTDILWRNRISTKKLYKKLIKDYKNIYILEKIAHPFILKKVFYYIKKYKKSSKYKLCIVDVPLLFEIKIQHKFDYIITVYCNHKVQKERLKKRKVDKKLLKLLLSRQIPIRKKIKLADFVIQNDNTSKSLLEAQVRTIITKLLTN